MILLDIQLYYDFQENRESLIADQFIHEHIAELLKNVRTKVLLILVKPYTNIRLTFISDELGVDLEDCESLVACCIRDEQIEGRIDQVNQTLVMKSASCEKRYTALNTLTKQIAKLNLSITKSFI